jgi:hypothetical protein
MQPIHFLDDHSYEKFLLYLYLVAAYSNYKIEDEELYMMKDKLEKYKLIKPENFPKYYKQVLFEFRTHNDYQMQQYIEGELDRFKLDDSAKNKIIKDIEDIVMADGIVENSEDLQLYKLKKILGVHNSD